MQTKSQEVYSLNGNQLVVTTTTTTTDSPSYTSALIQADITEKIGGISGLLSDIDNLLNRISQFASLLQGTAVAPQVTSQVVRDALNALSAGITSSLSTMP